MAPRMHTKPTIVLELLSQQTSKRLTYTVYLLAVCSSIFLAMETRWEKAEQVWPAMACDPGEVSGCTSFSPATNTTSFWKEIEPEAASLFPSFALVASGCHTDLMTPLSVSVELRSANRLLYSTGAESFSLECTHDRPSEPYINLLHEQDYAATQSHIYSSYLFSVTFHDFNLNAHVTNPAFRVVFHDSGYRYAVLSLRWAGFLLVTSTGFWYGKNLWGMPLRSLRLLREQVWVGLLIFGVLVLVEPFFYTAFIVSPTQSWWFAANFFPALGRTLILTAILLLTDALQGLPTSPQRWTHCPAHAKRTWLQVTAIGCFAVGSIGEVFVTHQASRNEVWVPFLTLWSLGGALWLIAVVINMTLAHQRLKFLPYYLTRWRQLSFRFLLLFVPALATLTVASLAVKRSGASKLARTSPVSVADLVILPAYVMVLAFVFLPVYFAFIKDANEPTPESDASLVPEDPLPRVSTHPGEKGRLFSTPQQYHSLETLPIHPHSTAYQADEVKGQDESDHIFSTHRATWLLYFAHQAYCMLPDAVPLWELDSNLYDLERGHTSTDEPALPLHPADTLVAELQPEAQDAALHFARTKPGTNLEPERGQEDPVNWSNLKDTVAKLVGRRPVSQAADSAEADQLQQIRDRLNRGEPRTDLVLQFGFRWVRALYSESTHTLCLIAVHCQTRAVVVSFRGTVTLRNTLSDLTFWRVGPQQRPSLDIPGKIHRGFWACFLSIRDGLLRTLAELFYELDRRPGGEERIFFTGHSLGGAVATLCAFDVSNLIHSWPDSVARRRVSVDPSLFHPSQARSQGTMAPSMLLGHRPLTKVQVYSFGAPRIGDHKFAEAFNTCVPACFRVVMEGDPVAAMPKCVCLFKHVGHRVVLEPSGNCLVDLSWVEDFVRWTKSRFRQHKISNHLPVLKRACRFQQRVQRWMMEKGLEEGHQLYRITPTDQELREMYLDTEERLCMDDFFPAVTISSSIGLLEHSFL